MFTVTSRSIPPFLGEGGRSELKWVIDIFLVMETNQLGGSILESKRHGDLDVANLWSALEHGGGKQIPSDGALIAFHFPV